MTRFPKDRVSFSSEATKFLVALAALVLLAASFAPAAVN